MFGSEIEQISKRIVELPRGNNRVVVGIAGPPAAGKSTLAEMLVKHLNQHDTGSAKLVPMDGFHHSNETLDALGLRHRKGAPGTFDAAGFVELIGKLVANVNDIRYPVFDRQSDRAVPDAELISAETKIAIVEGNYLLLSELPWSNLKQYFDLTVLVRPDIETLQRRLIQRWIAHGFDLSEAEDKAMGNDIPNAKYVLQNSVAADLEFEGI